MWAIQMDETGGPDVMHWRELADPEAHPGQIVVDVAAAGLNYIDTYQRSGLYDVPMPFVLGLVGAYLVHRAEPVFTDAPATAHPAVHA